MHKLSDVCFNYTVGKNIVNLTYCYIVQPVPVPRKRGRLMKNGAFPNNNIDGENVEAMPLKQMGDDESNK